MRTTILNVKVMGTEKGIWNRRYRDWENNLDVHYASPNTHRHTHTPTHQSPPLNKRMTSRLHLFNTLPRFSSLPMGRNEFHMEIHIFMGSTVVALSGRTGPTTGRDLERCPVTNIQTTPTFAPAPKEMTRALLSSSFTLTSP